MKIWKHVLPTSIFIFTFCFVYAQPDIIYYNGHVITMDPVSNVQEAISIKGAFIDRIGSNSVVRNTAGSQTIEVDLMGRTILPGFVDPHMHLFELAALNGESLEDVQDEIVRNGITSVGEAYVDEDVLLAFQAFEATEKLYINLDMYLVYNSNCSDSIGEWFLNYPPDISTDSNLRVAGVKIFTDGGTCGTLPALTFEYPAGGFGDLFLSNAQLNNMVSVANDNGYPLLLHAQGDLAVNQSLDSYENLLNGAENVLRHRLDHNSFIDPMNMGRYSDIGIIPVNFGAFPTCAEVNSGALTNAFGAAHIDWLENHRLMHDENSGLPIAWKSDAPNLVLNPIEHLYSYVTKKEVDTDGSICSPPNWLAAHAIAVEEALYMMTINAAYALHRDQFVGSLISGKHADFVFLSDNPLTINPDDLNAITVSGTMSKGENVYCALGNEFLCVSDIVSVNELTGISSLTIPNPISQNGDLRLQLSRPLSIQISITNIEGKIKSTERIQFSEGENHHLLDVSELKNGVHFVRLKNENGSVCKKLVVHN